MNQALSTQKGLNQLFKSGLIEDGILGKKTIEAMQYPIMKLKRIYANKGYIWDETFNLIGVRTSDIFTNQFSDFCLIHSSDYIWAFPMSTKAGTISVQQGISNWFKGLNGVAVLKEGQYIDTWTFQSAWWSGLPFFYQAKPVTIYRDANTDNIINRDSKQQTDLFGINIHSWKGFIYFFVGNLSSGCQVFTQDVWELLVPLISKGDIDGLITYTLLNTTDWN